MEHALTTEQEIGRIILLSAGCKDGCKPTSDQMKHLFASYADAAHDPTHPFADYVGLCGRNLTKAAKTSYEELGAHLHVSKSTVSRKLRHIEDMQRDDALSVVLALFNCARGIEAAYSIAYYLFSPENRSPEKLTERIIFNQRKTIERAAKSLSGSKLDSLYMFAESLIGNAEKAAFQIDAKNSVADLHAKNPE